MPVTAFMRLFERLRHLFFRRQEKQFVARCALFAGPKTAQDSIQETLREAYKMRCDIEHVHEWDRSLQGYPAAERENIALWKTRQMEALACAAYTKILLDSTLAAYFYDDNKLAAFWQRPEDEIRAAFGNVCDISQVSIVRQYDGFGRAAYSEWPSGLVDTLRPRRSQPSLDGSPRSLQRITL
jgi:hypothetical protein